MNTFIHKSLVEENKYQFLLDWYRRFFIETQKMYDASEELHVKVALNLCNYLLRLHNKGYNGIIEWNKVQRVERSVILDEITSIIKNLIKNRIEMNCLIEFLSLDIISFYADLVYV